MGNDRAVEAFDLPLAADKAVGVGDALAAEERVAQASEVHGQVSCRCADMLTLQGGGFCARPAPERTV